MTHPRSIHVEIVDQPTMDRFQRKFEVDDNGCWTWLGFIRPCGYGTFKHKGITWMAHRFAYEALVAPIPFGMQLDHLCRVRHCVNPEHLEPVTPRENTMRSTSFAAVNAEKDSCVNGHEFTPENTRYTRRANTNRTRRACRACGRVSSSTYRARKRGTQTRASRIGGTP